MAAIRETDPEHVHDRCAQRRSPRLTHTPIRRKSGCEDEMDEFGAVGGTAGALQRTSDSFNEKSEETEKRGFHPTRHGTPNGKLPC